MTRQKSKAKASEHVLKRYRQRSEVVDITRAEIEYRFEHGDRVEVVGKDYDEARFVDEGGTDLVLLRKEYCITTVVYADEEEVLHEDKQTE